MSGLWLPDVAARQFVVSIEVMPPRGHQIDSIVESLAAVPADSAQFLNVADSPMARPRMSPTVLAGRLQQSTAFETVVHLTVRDRNRVALESEVLGARATGVRHHLAVSGDPIEFCDRGAARAVGDVSVPELIRLCRQYEQCVGVVFDGEPGCRARELEKLEAKVAAGAEFVITQPIYTEAAARDAASAAGAFGVPVLMGILPLYSSRHARFLHEHVPGIPVPERLRQRMDLAEEAIAEGVRIARELLAVARAQFQGACLMLPFGHYEMAAAILAP
jgi:homocysteine S-methyltransferase